MDIISIEDLQHVTGGAGSSGGGMWSWIKDTAGSLLGGMGTNINAQIGNNQRSAQANTAPVTLGDNSPIQMK